MRSEDSPVIQTLNFSGKYGLQPEIRNTTMNDNITDEVIDTVERIENMDSHHDMDPLEVKVTCLLDGTVREIVCVLTVGGPHIEVNVSNGTVFGAWGGESHTVPIMDSDTEAMLDSAHRYYKHQFEAHR